MEASGDHKIKRSVSTPNKNAKKKGAGPTKNLSSKVSAKIPWSRPLRFSPDPFTVAFIDLKPKRVFRPTLMGLVLNESLSGCAIVVSSTEKLVVGENLKIKIGKISPLVGEIAWIKTLDKNILKIGIKLID